MMQMCVMLMCVTLIGVTGCRTLERTIRHEQERKVREIVHEEVPVVVRNQIGDWALRYAPWALIPAAGGAGMLHKRKRAQNG